VPRTSTFKSGPVPVEDAGTFQLHRFTPDTGIHLYSAGVSNLDGSVPANLYIQLVDHTTDSTLYSNSIDFEEGTPLNTFNVPGDDVEARISNQTGTLVDCHGFIDIQLGKSATVPVSDLGTGTGALTALEVPVSDLGTGSGSFYGETSVEKTDIGTGSGSFYGETSVEKTDIGTGADALTSLEGFVKKTGAGAGIETVNFLLNQLKDTGAGQELVKIPIGKVLAKDTATGENYVLTAKVPEHALKSQDYYEELVKLLEILNIKM